MSGRRTYPRFRQLESTTGQMRISRDVAVQPDEAMTEISVTSDTAGVVGEVLTLALVSSTGETELRVRVADSRPFFMDGLMRHRVRLALLPAE